VGSGVVAVVATVFRSSAGLPPLAWTFRSWRIGVVAAAAVLTLTVTVGGHVLWHTAYIGLGWYPNPYGIEYLDESGMASAARIDPNAAYATPAYEAVLRSEVIRIATTDPGFVISVMARKIVAAIGDAMPFALFLPLALWRRPALLIPGLLTLVPVVTGGPWLAYETGWLAFIVAAPIIAFDRLMSERHLRRRDHADVLDGPRVPRGGVVGVQAEQLRGRVVVVPRPGEVAGRGEPDRSLAQRTARERQVVGGLEEGCERNPHPPIFRMVRGPMPCAIADRSTAPFAVVIASAMFVRSVSCVPESMLAMMCDSSRLLESTITTGSPTWREPTDATWIMAVPAEAFADSGGLIAEPPTCVTRVTISGLPASGVYVPSGSVNVTSPACFCVPSHPLMNR
jgi:hypothetical protein